jgi:hypothetical protein
MTERKTVLIIDESLSLGVIANTSSVLSVSLGKLCPDMVGHDLLDGSGELHHGITTMPIPILKGTPSRIKEIKNNAKGFESELIVIGLLDATMTTKSYEEYELVMKGSLAQELNYLGIALFGEKKLVNKLTGSLGLLR